jgi:hypothetical protein
MGGTVVIIIVLLLFPVLVLMSSVLLAGVLGWLLGDDREDAYEGTEYLALGGYGPKTEDEDEEEPVLIA